MRHRWLIGLAATLALGAGTAAKACSPAYGYVRPSNFELAQIADAIVVATPLSALPSGEDDHRSQRFVRLRVTESLKGDLAGEIEVGGLELGSTQRSDPEDIFFSHPEGHMGPCNRMTLAEGGSYLLFLGSQDGRLGVLRFPFSRINEDYAGPDSAWSRAVRTYLDIQREPDGMVELARLEALKAQLEAKPGRTRYDAMLAADIGGHLGSVSPWKPTGYLLAAYDDLKAGRPPRHAPRNPAYDQEQSEAAMVSEMLLGKRREEPRKPVRDPRETAILEALIEPGHADAAAVFEPFLRDDAPAGDLKLGLRFLAENGQFRRAYDLIEARVPARLANAASSDEARTLLWTTGNVLEDPYGGEPPRWRTDPSVQARWPRLSVALARQAQERFGIEVGFADGPKAFLGGDYRADPELTLMISGNDNAITDWARAQLVAPGAAQAPADAAHDPLKLPLDITLRWIGVGAADEEVGMNRMFCAGPARRAMLIDTWALRSSWFGADLAKRMAASPQLDEAERARLASAVRAWRARLARSDERDLIERDKVMARLARGKRPTAQDLGSLRPLTCPSA